MRIGWLVVPATPGPPVAGLLDPVPLLTGSRGEYLRVVGIHTDGWIHRDISLVCFPFQNNRRADFAGEATSPTDRLRRRAEITCGLTSPRAEFTRIRGSTYTGYAGWHVTAGIPMKFCTAHGRLIPEVGNGFRTDIYGRKGVSLSPRIFG